MVARVRSYHFAKFHKNPLIDLLYNERLRRILNMMKFGADKKSIILDLGCGEGYFSRVLSLQSITIALDVDKRAVVKAQVQRKASKLNKLHFIVADVSFLPFVSHSVNVVVCASVLEHIRDVDSVAKQIKDILKEEGIFVAGYPIETKFFKLIWRFISPRNFRCIDQNQTFWYNHSTHKHYCYWECPFTHKQDYQAIRDVLRKYFRILRKEKLPFNVLSDSLSYYECVKCTPT